MASKTNIEISNELFDALKKKVEGSSFTNVSELAEFILQQFLEVEAANKDTALTEKESKDLHERLRKLGYE